jgi:hypothetical protein
VIVELRRGEPNEWRIVRRHPDDRLAPLCNTSNTLDVSQDRRLNKPLA